MKTLIVIAALLALQGCALYLELLREAHTPEQEARSAASRAHNRSLKLDRLIREHEKRMEKSNGS